MNCFFDSSFLEMAKLPNSELLKFYNIDQKWFKKILLDLQVN